MDNISLELIAFGAVVFAAAGILVCLRSINMQKDSKRLADAVVALCAGSAPWQAGELMAQSHLRVWHYVKMLNAMRGHVGNAQNAYHEALNFSAKMSEQGEGLEQAAEEVCRLLSAQGSGKVSGVMVLLSGEGSKLEVMSSAGIPRARFQDFVVDEVAQVLEGPSPHASWKYVGDSASSEALRAFDVRLMLTVPLDNAHGTCGAIWIAFQNELTATKERREFLQLVAENVATNFRTAIQVKHRTENVERERDFLLGMSHDLRAPGETALFAINAVRSSCASLSEEDKQHLDIAGRCVARQQSLVGDVLKWAQHKKGVLQAYPTDVSLEALCGELVQHNLIASAQKGLCLNCDVIPAIWVNVDCQHVKRIFENLLSNAIKYTDCGSIRIAFDKTSTHCEIRIIDTGIGIPGNMDSEQLFEQFVRMPNARSRSGAGLGLSLCRALAEQNGGYLSYAPNSEHGSGSVFSVALPLADRSETSPQPHLPLGRVLLVDDDITVCKTIKRYLTDAADCFEMVENLEMAFGASQRHHFDLVITDLNVGAQIAYPLIEMLDDIPVIVLTGTSDLEAVNAQIAHERYVILEKPVDRLTIRQAVAQLLKPMCVNGTAHAVAIEAFQ